MSVMDIRQIIDLPVPGTADAPREPWGGDDDGLANSDWDANWFFTDAGFGNLPQRNQARQHEGFSSPASSPEPQAAPPRGGDTRRGRRGVLGLPCPSMTPPRPSLDFDLRIGVVFGPGSPDDEDGPGAGVIAGGSWTASFGSGVVIVRSSPLDSGRGSLIDLSKQHAAGWRARSGPGDRRRPWRRRRGVQTADRRRAAGHVSGDRMSTLPGTSLLTFRVLYSAWNCAAEGRCRQAWEAVAWSST